MRRDLGERILAFRRPLLPGGAVGFGLVVFEPHVPPDAASHQMLRLGAAAICATSKRCHAHHRELSQNFSAPRVA